MDLELFKEFVMLAKYLNFRETAERLNLSQPTLSRHISQLEADLQTQLFERRKQFVRLTTIGQAFLPEAQKVIDSMDQAMMRISDFRKGITGQLSVGYKLPYGISGWGLTLGAFKARYLEIMLDIHNLSNFMEISEGLTSEKLDVVMLLDTGAFAKNFRAIKLADIPLCAVINEDSDLAQRSELRCEDLNGNVLVFPNATNAQGLLPAMKQFLRAHGLHHYEARDYISFDDILLYVNLNNYIGIVPRCYLPHTSNDFFGTRIYELVDTREAFHLYVLARKNNQNPATELFFATCQDVVDHLRERDTIN